MPAPIYYVALSVVVGMLFRGSAHYFWSYIIGLSGVVWLYLAARKLGSAEAGKCLETEESNPCAVLILGESLRKNEGEKSWVG